jgi:hypothetical protein
VDPSLVPACKQAGSRLTPKVGELHDSAWWAAKVKGFDFHQEDRVDAETFNRILWEGIMGDLPYPTMRNGLDLRKNRAQRLKEWAAARERRYSGKPAPAGE